MPEEKPFIDPEESPDEPVEFPDEIDGGIGGLGEPDEEVL